MGKATVKKIDIYNSCVEFQRSEIHIVLTIEYRSNLRNGMKQNEKRDYIEI